MTIRFTEEEAKAYGFIKVNGDWVRGDKKTSRPNPHSTTLPITKSDSSIVAKEQNERKERTKTRSKKSHRIINDRTNHNDKESVSDRIYKINVISYRVRLCDPDNLVPKYYIDEMVRAGIIPDDSSKYIQSIEKKVIKVKKTEEEKTVIEVWQLFEK